MNQQLHKIRGWLEGQQAGYLDVLREMVAINSHTFNRDGVRRLADRTAELFSMIGFSPRYVEPKDSRLGPHLLLAHRGRTERTIVLVSHLDTVFTEEEEQRNDFVWREVHGRIYGPGTIDIKGGTVMAYLVLAALREFYQELYQEYSWLVLLNAAEEICIDDLSGRMAEVLPVNNLIAGLVFEGGFHREGRFHLAVSRKGISNGLIQVQAKGGHAGMSHHRSTNAIVELSHLIHQVAALTDYGLGITANVGVVRGGRQRNRVPDYAEIDFEIRTPSLDLMTSVFEKIEQMVARANASYKRDGVPCRVTLHLKANVPPPWPRNPGTQRLFSYWEQAAAELGFSVFAEDRGGGSDANNLSQFCPTIDGLGPGGTNAHCAEVDPATDRDQEYLLVDSIVPKALLDVVAITKLLESGALPGT